MKLAALALSAALVVLAPAVASACPACALRNDGGAMKAIVQWSMMGLPFAIATVVIFALRRAHKEEAEK